MSANNNKIPEDFLFDIDGRKSSFDFDDLVDPEDLKTKYRNNLYSGIVNVKKLFAKQFPELKQIISDCTSISIQKVGHLLEINEDFKKNWEGRGVLGELLSYEMFVSGYISDLERQLISFAPKGKLFRIPKKKSRDVKVSDDIQKELTLVIKTIDKSIELIDKLAPRIFDNYVSGREREDIRECLKEYINTLTKISKYSRNYLAQLEKKDTKISNRIG